MTPDINWALGVLAETGTPSDRKGQQCMDLRSASRGALTTTAARDLVEQVNDLPNVERALITSAEGEPLHVVSPRNIIEEGSRLAFELAAVCDDKAALVRVQHDALKRVGTEGYGYVAASALTHMAEVILSGAFAVAKAYGTDLQADMAAFARGEEDPEAG